MEIGLRKKAKYRKTHWTMMWPDKHIKVFYLLTTTKMTPHLWIAPSISSSGAAKEFSSFWFPLLDELVIAIRFGKSTAILHKEKDMGMISHRSHSSYHNNAAVPELVLNVLVHWQWLKEWLFVGVSTEAEENHIEEARCTLTSVVCATDALAKIYNLFNKHNTQHPHGTLTSLTQTSHESHASNASRGPLEMAFYHFR